METQTERWPVEELWPGALGVQSVNIDWQEVWNEGDGWVSFEAPSCPVCDSYASWDAEAHGWYCGECAHEEEIDAHENGAEGPMMSYHYPLEDLRRMGDDPYAAAEAIRDLPLCVVRFSDGSFSLALTGGGMDLSWEICEAFTRLGYLPPLNFCDLPGMVGYPRDDAHRYVVRACVRSAEVAERQAASARERLVERYADVFSVAS